MYSMYFNYNESSDIVFIKFDMILILLEIKKDIKTEIEFEIM